MDYNSPLFELSSVVGSMYAVRVAGVFNESSGLTAM